MSTTPTPEAPAGPVQRFSYKKAMNCLTETEKSRMLCVMLTLLDHIKPSGPEMKIAAAQYGGAEGGFIKSYSNHMKKLRDNECYIIEGEDLDSIPTPPVTPAKTPKKAAPKRKAAAEGAEGADAESTPAKKPRAAPKKKSAAKVKSEDEAEETIKGDGEASAGAEEEKTAI